jgi:hypothetical protein
MHVGMQDFKIIGTQEDAERIAEGYHNSFQAPQLESRQALWVQLSFHP